MWVWVTWVEVWSDFFLSFFIFGGLVVYIYRTFVLLFAPFWLISCLCFFSAWFFVVFRDVYFLALFVFCVLMLWLCSSVHFCSVLGVFSWFFSRHVLLLLRVPLNLLLFWTILFVLTDFLCNSISFSGNFPFLRFFQECFLFRCGDRFTWILSDGFCYHFSHKFICLISLSLQSIVSYIPFDFTSMPSPFACLSGHFYCLGLLLPILGSNIQLILTIARVVYSNLPLSSSPPPPPTWQIG